VAAAVTIVLLCLPLGRWVSVVMIPTAFMLYQLALSDGFSARLFSSGPVVLLGAASYAIYLLQYPVRAWTKLAFSHLGPSVSLLGSLLTPVILIAFSIVVFRYWEEPLRKLMRPARLPQNAKE